LLQLSKVLFENNSARIDFPIGKDTSEGPNKQVLLDLITLLVSKVAKIMPSEPTRLSEQQRREIRARLKQGEPKGQYREGLRC
jgi:hypothetical protein